MTKLLVRKSYKFSRYRIFILKKVVFPILVIFWLLHAVRRKPRFYFQKVKTQDCMGRHLSFFHYFTVNFLKKSNKHILAKID